MKPALVILASLALAACGQHPTRAGCRQFDRATWAGADLNGRTRNQLADWLLSRCDMRGMTTAEVMELLGRPPATDYFKGYDLVYLLGPERGYLAVDSEWLVFKLDRAGKVVEYRISRD